MEKEMNNGAEEISVEQLEEVVGGASYSLAALKSGSFKLGSGILSVNPVLKAGLVKMTCGSYNI